MKERKWSYALKLLICLIFILPCFCLANSEESYVDQEFTGYNSSKMVRQTRDALLSYDLVQQRTNYWGKRLEKMIFGEYAENFLFLTPLVTGKVEFRVVELDFYVDARKEKSGVNYTFNF